jgi:hypothetical protein
MYTLVGKVGDPISGLLSYEKDIFFLSILLNLLPGSSSLLDDSPIFLLLLLIGLVLVLFLQHSYCWM